MKKNLIVCAACVLALIMTACGGSSRMTVSTSSRVDLARSVRYTPTLANLSVQGTRVEATCTVAEMEGLKGDQQRQFVVAKALATVGADVLVAPRFTTAKGDDGKMTSMTVVGYPATFISFRPLTPEDVPFNNRSRKVVDQNRVSGRFAMNTLTIADIEIGQKVTLTMTPADLGGNNKNEKSALAAAKKKMMRQEKVDFVYQPQYTTTIVDGAISTFTLTAYPAKYVNYRAAQKADVEALNLSTSPAIFYNLTADLKPVAGRIQLKFGSQDATAKEADLKEIARAAALAKYKADFLLNEKFYFDYQEKVITHVTICGTPAVYANFRPLGENDVIDLKIMSVDGGAGEDDAPKGLIDMILGLFKKK